jgi:guanylate kinase
MDSLLSQEISEQKNRSVLLVLTGPTAAGKDTVINELVKRDPSIVKVITTTSRAMRDGESEENPYYFLPRQRFEELISEGAFFEWVEFRGELYEKRKSTFAIPILK